MERLNSNTDIISRKRSKHLSLDRRSVSRLCIIKANPFEQSPLRLAARTLLSYMSCGTPQRTSQRGRAPIYIYKAKRSQVAYAEHRKYCRKPYKLDDAGMEPFIQWLVGQVHEHHWSLDACVGYTRLQQVFSMATMVCPPKLYNML